MMTKTLTILLVESNSANTQRVLEMLMEVEAFKFQLLHFFTVNEALSYLRAPSELPSLAVLLLDLSLPDTQAVTQLLQASPDIPIVVMSDLKEEALITQTLQNGAQDYLVKSQINGQLLVHSIRYAIDKQRMQQQLDTAQAALRRLSEQTQQLEQEKTLLEAIVNSIQEGICVVQPDGKVVLTNPAQRQIWGFEPEAALESAYNWRSALPACSPRLLALLHPPSRHANDFSNGVSSFLASPSRLQIQKPDGSIPTAEELPISCTLRGEPVTDYELVVCGPNAEQKWLSINGVRVSVSVAGNNDQTQGTLSDRLNPQQQIQLAINTTRDITERKRIEQALRESEDKFRTLYESTSAAVILFDKNGIFDANSAALQMFGCTQPEQFYSRTEERECREDRDKKETGKIRLILGCPPYQPYPPSPRSTSHCTIGFSPPLQPNGQDSLTLANEYIATAIAEGSCRFDWIYRKCNGEDFPAEVTLTLIELGNRKVLQAAIYNIAERKITETQLVEAKEAAEAGSRAKSEFLATISHELRTPLNAILGLSGLLSQEILGSLNEKQKEYVNCIQSSGEHLLSLINDLLDLSKVEAGKEQLTFVPLNIQELCEYCLAMVREQAYEQGLKLNFRIDPQANICIADERRCKQMLLNLLSNAVKFTLVGEVSLIVRQLPQGIAFIVEDTGIGIAAQKLPLLFEPFRQLDSGLNRQFPGTGLGLALTRSLARLHGGDVTVESKLGEGSKFTLYLPDLSSEDLLFSASSEDSTNTQGLSCSLTGRCRILLVEHDERSAMLLKDYLEVIGHRVEHLTNTTDFLNSVRSYKPDLILMDVNLRGNYTGFDLLAALRRESDTKQIRVVMVTALAMVGDRERCLEAGADDYLSKPIGIAQLEAILMRYL